MPAPAATVASTGAAVLADPLTRRRRRYHFHLPGLVYGLTTVFLAVGTINSQNNLLFWSFGLAIAGLLVSGVISGAALMGVEIERAPVEPVSAGALMTIRYRVRNRNRLFPAFALHINEQPDPRAPGGDWRDVLSPPHAFVPHLGPRQTVEVEARVPTLRRGRRHFDRLGVWTVFPFGLSRKSVIFTQARRIVVRPAPMIVNEGAMRSTPDPGALAARSQRRSPTPGEFFALREHREGDSPRSVAWRASARAGTLLTRQFTSARVARAWIVLELGADDAIGERAISIAAGTVEAACRRGAPAGIVVPASGLSTPAREGRAHADAILDALAAIPATGRPDAPAAAFDLAPGDVVFLIASSRGRSAPDTPGIVLINAADAAPSAEGPGA